MAHQHTARSVLHNLHYQKTTSEIVEAIERKLVQMKAKIIEREQRVLRIRKEYDITDQNMIEILTQQANNARNDARNAVMSYSLSASAAGSGEDDPGERIIGAGVINNILTEKGYIESEKEIVTKMERIGRNLRPLREFADGNATPYLRDAWTLTDEDLDFLGF